MFVCLFNTFRVISNSVILVALLRVTGEPQRSYNLSSLGAEPRSVVSKVFLYSVYLFCVNDKIPPTKGSQSAYFQSKIRERKKSLYFRGKTAAGHLSWLTGYFS